MFENTERRLREFKANNDGSAVGFIIGMFIVLILAVNLLPEVARQAASANANTSVLSFSGITAMVGVLVLLFVILPLVILARAAS